MGQSTTSEARVSRQRVRHGSVDTESVWQSVGRFIMPVRWLVTSSFQSDGRFIVPVRWWLHCSRWTLHRASQTDGHFIVPVRRSLNRSSWTVASSFQSDGCFHCSSLMVCFIRASQTAASSVPVRRLRVLCQSNGWLLHRSSQTVALGVPVSWG